MCGPRGPATRFSHLPQSHKCWNQPCNVVRLALTAITGFGYCAANAINIYKFTHSLLRGNCKIRNARCADKAHTQLALVLHVYAIYCALTFFHCSSIILFSLSLLFCTGTSQYMYVEFVTSPAGPLLNTGFHFNVGNWPGHVETAGIKHGICDWLLSSDSLKDSSASEGIFLSIAHWYPPNTSCSYHIKGRTGEIVRLYFPR